MVYVHNTLTGLKHLPLDNKSSILFKMIKVCYCHIIQRTIKHTQLLFTRKSMCCNNRQETLTESTSTMFIVSRLNPRWPLTPSVYMWHLTNTSHERAVWQYTIDVYMLILHIQIPIRRHFVCSSDAYPRLSYFAYIRSYRIRELIHVVDKWILFCRFLVVFLSSIKNISHGIAFTSCLI